MNDILSQQEIDALMRMGEQNNTGDQLLTPRETDVLGEIGNISMGTAATTMSVLLHKRVDITTPVVSIVNLADLEKDYPTPCVAVEIAYTEGLEGSNLLIIKSDDVKVITDLLMGGSGAIAEGELTELHLSAISEVMNQMIGSSCTSMASFLKRSVNIAPPKASIVDFNSDLQYEFFEKDCMYIRTAFRMVVEGLIDSHIMQIMTVPFGKSMVEMVYELFSDAGDQSGTMPEEHESGSRQAAGHGAEAARAEQPSHQAAGILRAGQSQGRANAPAMQSGEPAGGHERKVDVRPVQFQSLDTEEAAAKHNGNMDLILDIPLQITVELGRARKEVREILKLSEGTIIELDKLAGEPVDVLVNGKCIATGEVVVIDENFGVRINDIVSPSKRITRV